MTQDSGAPQQQWPCGFSPAYISEHLKGAPLVNIETYWPMVIKEATALGMIDHYPLIAFVATIGVETPAFKPIDEYGGEEYFINHYWLNFKTRVALGNRSISDSYTYHGRGLIQLTGYANYLKMSHRFNVDLVDHPEQANEPDTAAKIFCAYMHDHGVDVHARRAGTAIDANAKQAEWYETRRLVNGGLNSIAEYMQIIDGLSK